MICLCMRSARANCHNHMLVVCTCTLSPGIDLKSQQYFLPTSNVLSQSEDLNIHWNDGYRLDITVRAYDIFDGYIEDTTTVYKDTSPPSIKDLWLTNGDRVNISIHSIEDFTEMKYVN